MSHRLPLSVTREVTKLFVLTIVLFSRGLIVSADCLNNELIYDLPFRLTSYVSAWDEPNICDYELDETAWYRFTSDVTNMIPEACVERSHCGTAWPIWINGSHPTAPGTTADVTACAPDAAGDCCGKWHATIKVELCQGDPDPFYVYQLKSVTTCDMGYCAILKDPAILPQFPGGLLTPVFSQPITINRVQPGDPPCPFDDFRFECTVNYDMSQWTPDTRISVWLTLDGVPDESTIQVIPNTLIPNVEASMVVPFESKLLAGKVGKTVSCQVEAYFDGHGIHSEAKKADYGHWVGITFTPPAGYNYQMSRIEMQIDQIIEIEFHPTVPLGIPTCNGNAGDLAFPYDQTPSPKCSIFFKGETGSSTRNSHSINVKVDHSLGCESYASTMSFRNPRPLNIESASNVTNIWVNYTIDNFMIFVTCDNSNPAPLCYSYLDPFIMRTDGGPDINPYSAGEGDFLLYYALNLNRLFEVHVRHVSCGVSRSGQCNCAIAVRENNNIIGLIACDSPPTPIRYMLDRNTVPGSANIVGGFNYYKISMPSGAYVEIDFVDLHYFNVYVHSLREDVYHTPDGLCGNYNLDQSDELNVVNYDSFRLNPDESYINGHIFFPTCVPLKLKATICGCERLSPLYFNCTDRNSNYRDITVSDTLGTDVCLRGKRKRRQSDNSHMLNDSIIMPEDFPVPQWNIPTEPSTPPTWPTPSGVTEDQASERCRSLIEGSAVYDTCSGFTDIELEHNVCTLNILLTGSLEAGTRGVLQNFFQVCLFNIENSMNSSSTDPARQPGAVRSVLQAVKANVCPGSTTPCSGHGSCTQGQCTCDTGYVGIDCSLASDAVPQITGFRRGCTCDARKFTCISAFIAGSQLFDSSNLNCRFILTGQSPATEFVNPAVLQSLYEVRCDIPLSPLAEGAEAVHVWNVSVTNDGVNYGNTLQLTVFDSNCFNCSCDAGCTARPGMCGNPWNDVTAAVTPSGEVVTTTAKVAESATTTPPPGDIGADPTTTTTTSTSTTTSPTTTTTPTRMTTKPPTAAPTTKSKITEKPKPTTKSNKPHPATTTTTTRKPTTTTTTRPTTMKPTARPTTRATTRPRPTPTPVKCGKKCQRGKGKKRGKK